MDGDNWRHYFAAASTISSDGEMRSLLVTVMQSNRLNQLGWTLALRLIDEEISSSGEKGSALRQAAKSLPDNEALKNRYNNAVKNVSSRSTRESLALQ